MTVVNHFDGNAILSDVCCVEISVRRDVNAIIDRIICQEQSGEIAVSHPEVAEGIDRVDAVLFQYARLCGLFFAEGLHLNEICSFDEVSIIYGESIVFGLHILRVVFYIEIDALVIAESKAIADFAHACCCRIDDCAVVSNELVVRG